MSLHAVRSKRTHGRQCPRTQVGVHSFELIAGLIFLVPVVLYGIDYATVLYAGAMNDNMCTNAARAAASGPPTNFTTSGDTPAARAAGVIAPLVRQGSIITMQSTVRIREIFNQPIPSAPFGGPMLGTVTVKTRCDVYPPFNLPLVPQDVQLYTSQTFPWTWTMASTPAPSTTPEFMPAMPISPSFAPFNNITQSIP